MPATKFAFLLLVLGSASLATAQESARLAVAPTEQLSEDARTRVERALGELGADVAAPANVAAAAGVPTLEGITDPKELARIARAAELDGLLLLDVTRQPVPGEQGARAYARLRVLDPGGQLVWSGQVPLARDDLSDEDAETLASLAVQAITAPDPALTAEGTTDSGTTDVEQYPGPVAPPPRLLGLTKLSVNPLLSFRYSRTTPPGDLQPFSFSTGTPYPGLELQAESLPVDRWWGFGVTYSFAGVLLDVPDTPAGERDFASEHRLLVEGLGRFPFEVLGGELVGSLGVAWQGFIVDPDLETVLSPNHVSPRIGLQWERQLWHSLRLETKAGLRPFSVPVGEWSDQFGDTRSSIGVDARVALTGSLEGVLPNLRWMAGYDYLRYWDEFGGTPDTDHYESYHRILIGVSYDIGNEPSP